MDVNWAKRAGIMGRKPGLTIKWISMQEDTAVLIDCRWNIRCLQACGREKAGMVKKYFRKEEGLRK